MEHLGLVTKRRAIAVLAGAAVLWLGGLLVANVALKGSTRARVAERVADSLQASATIDRGDLALVRGAFDLEDLAVRRDDVVGHLAIRVARLTCDLPPLGWALVDRDCRELALRGVRLEVSTAALFKLKRPKRAPLHVGRVVIDDARLELQPSALAPDLGRVAVIVEHAEAGETVFKTPVSWLFSLRTLRATVELPANITLRLGYANGELTVAGGMFGATPIALPLAIPVNDAADDAQAEIAKLVALAKETTARLVARKAEAWLKSTLSQP